MPRILIIEDNEKLADLLAQFLQRKGLEVRIAPDGRSGLRAFETGTYDLLLVDVKLPSMGGDDVCRKVRSTEQGKDVPLIMMGGSVADEAWTADLRQELGLAGFLIKPFSSEALFSLITSSLQAREDALMREAEPAAVPDLPATIRGDLSRTPFEQVLLYLLLKRGTGTLAAKNGTAERTFSFLDGAPCEIDTPAGADDFGSYLARRNLLSPAERQAYDDLRARTGTDTRDIFIKMGALSPEQFAAESRNFVQDSLIDCFSWRSGSAVFERRRSFLRSAPAAAFLPALFYRGFRAHLPAARLAAYREEKGDLYVDRTPEFYDYQNHLAGELPSTELFDRINGATTCSGIVSVLDSEDAALVLYTLDYLKALSYSMMPKRSGAVPPFPVRERKRQTAETETFEGLGGELSELAEEIAGIEVPGSVPQTAAADADVRAALEDDLQQQWETLKDRNYYEVFGMTPNTFSYEKLKSAYFDLTRTYSPEKFFASSGQVMELAEELLSLVSNAYTTLSDVVSKEHYDALLTQKAPTGSDEKKFYEQVQFQSGKVLLEKGQYEGAEKVFTTCLTLSPDRPEYQVYLALAIYSNPANRDNAAAVKKAKDLVNRSLLWEKPAIAYALKGTMLFDEGMLNLAEAEFGKALKQNPSNKTALKYLDLIRQRREDEERKGGLFQKLFK